MADYSPEKGPLPKGIDISHGIIRSQHSGVVVTAGAAIARRLALHGSIEPNCYDFEVLLPRWAPDHLRNLAALVDTYQKQLLPKQEDLLGIATVRFDPGYSFHRQWELTRSWVRTSFNGRDLAAILIHHVPALAGRSHKAHLHVLYPVRRLEGTFGAFVTLDKATLAAEWKAHIDSG